MQLFDPPLPCDTVQEFVNLFSDHIQPNFPKELSRIIALYSDFTRTYSCFFSLVLFCFSQTRDISLIYTDTHTLFFMG
jgi:hypothetical protein